MSRSSASVLVLLLASAPFIASAGEIQVNAGLGVRKSTWSGDVAGGGQLGAGYRFARAFAIDTVVWEETASVDSRLNTGLTVGLTGTLPLPTIRPSLRVYAIHQHEEGLVSVVEHPFGAVFGIGAGIRHRAGGGARLGVEVPFSTSKRVEWVALGGFEGTWFPDKTLGPSAYYGVMGGIGINYRLEELP